MLVNIISIILSTLLSGISIFIAIRAYKQGTKQIEISNKQSLFKERTNAIIKLNALFDLYENNKDLLMDCDDIPNFPFHLLANTKMLESIIEVAYNPLESKEQNNFLSKMEDLRAFSLELSLLWDCEESTIASCFILEYVQILCALYKQQVYIFELEKREKLELSDFKKKTKDMANHVGLNQYISNMNNLYNQMKEKNVLNILQEKIKLKMEK